MPSRLEKHMSFNINKKFIILKAPKFFIVLLDRFVKYLGKYDFNYLSQEIDIKVLDLVKQKEFYPYEYMSVSEKFKEKWSSEKKVYSSLTGTEISDKEYEHAFKDWNNEKDERFAGLEIKMGCFIVIRCV